MIFTEIALERVRCFRTQCRYAFKPGYNLICGPNESGKTTLAECIAILLDPTMQIPENAGFSSWGPPGNSRIGLVVTEGNLTFRLTHDFVNGLVTLARLNPQAQRYDIIAQDHAQAANILKQQMKFPGASLWRRVFVIDRSDMPSGRPRVIVQQVAAPAPQAPAQVPGQAFNPAYPMPGPAMPSAAPSVPAGYGMSPPEIKQRIDDLTKQLEQVKRVEKIQYEIDGLEAKLFDIENKTKDIKTLEDKDEQISQSIGRLESFQELPPDIVRRIEFFEEVQREHESKLYEIDTRLTKVKTEFTALKNRVPFFKSQYFIIGVACAVVGIVVQAAFVEKVDALKFVALLLILGGIGVTFWVLWNEISDRGKETEADKKLNEVEEQRKEELKKFDVEGSVIRRLMQEAGVEEAKELHEKLKDYKQLKDTQKSLEEKLQKAKEEAGYDKLSKEKTEIKEKIESLSRELREAGGSGFSQDSGDIQRQIDLLQYTLDHPGAPPPMQAPPAAPPYDPGFGGGTPQMGNPGNPGPPGGGGGGGFLGGDDGYLGGNVDYSIGGGQPAGMPPAPGDPDRTVIKSGAAMETPAGGGIETMVEELWIAAEQLTGLDRSTVIMQVSERFNVYVQAFTSKQYNEGDLSSEKNVSLRNASGSYTMLPDLSPSTQDAAWLALKIAVIENIYKKVRFPVVLDDPLRNLDDSRLAMVSKALKKIGSGCQVILLSTQRAHSKIADHTINLGPAE